ncbi:urea carboxylase-associated family protein [Klebsiella variicola subsp. variicola]|nr:urea carboxylase-associated family protein [Klebsiella variicola subsp. variicola]
MTAGSVLYSNLGHPLMTIVADYLRTARYPRRRLRPGEQHRALRSRTSAICTAAGTIFSAPVCTMAACISADIGANINFFMNVPVTPEGGLTFADGISAAGKYVELRAECNAMVLISTARSSTIPAMAGTRPPPRCWYGTDPLAALAFAGLSAVRRSRRPPESHADAPRLSAGSPGTTSGKDELLRDDPATL